MAERKRPISEKPASGSDKSTPPDHLGGDHARKAQQWGGGSKASKGPVTPADKRNQNSSAKS
jgi:hypothetical protein